MSERIPESWEDAFKTSLKISKAGGDPLPYLKRWLPDWEVAFPEEADMSDFAGSLTHGEFVEAVQARLASEGTLMSDEESEFWGRWAELMDERRLTFYTGGKEMPDDPFGVPVGKIDFFTDPT